MSNLRAWSCTIALTTISCSNAPDPAEPVASVQPTAIATAAPSASAVPEFPIRTMFVSDTLVDCEGEGPRKCMRVRASADAEWELFYDAIDGFTYEAGHAYELRVEARPVSGAAADASSLEYKLIEVVSKEKASPAP